jgi:hypothetical protein
MHGIGNMLFKNGFCYQGMFHKGSRDGLGFTFDLAGNKYKGEHRKGIREGQGIFKTNDNKLYEGGWSNNKMHGRGRETFANGECFIVYYKNGYKLEALASKTTSAMAPTYHDNLAGGSSSQASSQMMSAGNQSSSSQTLIGSYRGVTQKGNRNIHKSVLNSMGAEEEGSYKN